MVALPNTILDFRFWILKVLPLPSFSNSEDSRVRGSSPLPPVAGTVRNVATIKQNGITTHLAM